MARGEASKGSEAVTRAVRVRVAPSYLARRSDPEASEYVFAYEVAITNESPRAVRLRERRWLIVDADGERREVSGEGVVGLQPRLSPGESFTYSSFCPLQTPWGTMEGAYTFEGDVPDAGEPERFDVAVARFYLVADAPAPATPSGSTA